MNPEQKKITKSYFDTIGLTEIEAVQALDPYSWGSHGPRFYLWLYLGYLEIPDDKVRLYCFGTNYVNIAYIFRYLDDNNEEKFKNTLKKEYGINVIQMPPRRNQGN